jgi:hypothetical protein
MHIYIDTVGEVGDLGSKLGYFFFNLWEYVKVENP